jgi:hypothetical protein
MIKITTDSKAAIDEHGESSNMNSKVAIFITVILLIWLTGLLFWLFVLRDTWEMDNSQKIISMTNEIKVLDQTNKKEEAVAKYNELLLFLGDRKIKNPTISKLISDANATIYDTRRKLNAEKNLALIADFEENAKVLKSNGNFSDAKNKYVEALNVIETCGIDSPELDIIKKRVLDNIQFTEEKEHQRQLVELHEQQEKLRQIEAKENAKKRIDEIISNLPSLQDVLQSAAISNFGDMVIWANMILSLELEELNPNEKVSLDEYVLPKMEVIKRVQTADANISPLLTAYRDEILDVIDYVGWSWSRYGNHDKDDSNYIPIKFAVHQNQLVIILGAIFSDKVYNNINSSVNTPKKRASSFIQKEVLPAILNAKLPEKLKNARFGYLGMIFVYGNRNFIEDKHLLPEILGILISTRDLVDFVNRDLSQEAFLNKSSVYIASETSQFIKVEITLE